MTKKTKWFWLLIVVVLLVLPGLVWAGPKQEEKKTTTTTTTARPKVTGIQPTSYKFMDLGTTYNLPIADPPVRFVRARYWWAGADTSRGDADYRLANDATASWIMKRTGVQMAQEFIPGENEYQEAMIARIASGEKLPDQIMIPWSGFDMVSAIEAGKFIDMKPIMEAGWGVNILQVLEKTPAWKAFMTGPDGGIYWLGFNRAGVHMVGTVIRGDWLEKLGMKLPQTLDEFVRALKAFRDQDMNGNGIANDELPWAEWRTDVFWRSMQASFGMQPGGQQDWIQDQYGILTFAPTTENWKQLMTWLNMVYKEKLIPQDLNVANGGPGFEFMGGNLGAQQQLLDGQGKDASWARGMKVPGAYWLAMPPLAGPNGARGMAVRMPSNTESYGISGDSKLANEIVGMMDYWLATQEGNAANMGGVPDAWVIKDGWPQDSEKFKNASDDEKKKMRGVYFHPWWEYEERYFSWFSAQCIEDYNNFKQYIVPVVSWSDLYSTVEENEVIQEYWSGPEGISAYVFEMSQKFVSGEEPLTNWDQYVNQVKALGIDKVKEVNQARWDRMLRALGQL